MPLTVLTPLCFWSSSGWEMVPVDFNPIKQALRHKDQELVAMKQKNSRLIKESTKEGKSRVKVLQTETYTSRHVSVRSSRHGQ